MVHIHKKSGAEFDVGFVPDLDLTVIYKFHDIDDVRGLAQFVGWYFGGYDKQLTEDCINQWYKK